MTYQEPTMVNARPARRFVLFALVALVGLGALSQARPVLARPALAPAEFVETRLSR